MEKITVARKTGRYCKAVASLCFAKRKTYSPATRKLAAGVEPGGSRRIGDEKEKTDGEVCE